MALRGNHDEMMQRTVLSLNDGWDWANNGMASTARSYGLALVTAKMPAPDKRALIVEALRADERVLDDARWLATLPLIHQDQHRIYVHAGLRPRMPLDEQTDDDLLWIREPFLRHQDAFGKLVIHGHTPTMNGKPQMRANRIGLDTGAYALGVLTAALFDEHSAGPIAVLQTGDQRTFTPEEIKADFMLCGMHQDGLALTCEIFILRNWGEVPADWNDDHEAELPNKLQR